MTIGIIAGITGAIAALVALFRLAIRFARNELIGDYE